MLADWYISDPHFGHRNIISAYNIECRDFHTIDEHDEYIVVMWNSLVRPNDKVLILGDFAFQCATKIDEIAPRLNGRKTLIKGNHDIGKLVTYSRYFEDVCSVKEEKLRGRKLLFFHYPVHPSQLTSRYWANVHGHLHMDVITKTVREGKSRVVIPDQRYINICCEHTNMRPISHEQLMTKLDENMSDIHGNRWRDAI